MKIFRSTSLLILCLIAANLGYSQDADKILKASKAKFNSLTDISGRITFTLNNPNLSKPEIKAGNVWLKKSKYKVAFAGEEMYCNGKFVWTYVKATAQTTKLDFDPQESLSADRVFQIYEDESKSKYEGLEGTRHKITVFSTKENADIWKTVVWVNSSTNLIEKATMYSRGGSTYTYELANITLNTAVDDSIFNYDEAAAKRAGVYINDLTGE